MGVLWRCALVSLVVALAYQPFTVHPGSSSFSWWELLYGLFTSWAWAASFLKQIAVFFLVILLASWLSVRWVLRTRPAGGEEREGPDSSRLNRIGGKRGAANALGRIVLVCLAVALVAPVVIWPLTAAGLEDRPVVSLPNSPEGEIGLHYESWDHWWQRFLYPFQVRGAWHFYVEASGAAFVLGLVGSLLSAVWVVRWKVTGRDEGLAT